MRVLLERMVTPFSRGSRELVVVIDEHSEHLPPSEVNFVTCKEP